jgi:hypothetical protein
MYDGSNENKHDFLIRRGAELRALRLKTEDGTGEPMGLGAIAEVLNAETASRDRISKLERGVSGIDFFDYLRLMWFYRDVAGADHPGVALARRLLSAKTRGAKV